MCWKLKLSKSFLYDWKFNLDLKFHFTHSWTSNWSSVILTVSGNYRGFTVQYNWTKWVDIMRKEEMMFQSRLLEITTATARECTCTNVYRERSKCAKHETAFGIFDVSISNSFDTKQAFALNTCE